MLQQHRRHRRNELRWVHQSRHGEVHHLLVEKEKKGCAPTTNQRTSWEAMHVPRDSSPRVSQGHRLINYFPVFESQLCVRQPQKIGSRTLPMQPRENEKKRTHVPSSCADRNLVGGDLENVSGSSWLAEMDVIVLGRRLAESTLRNVQNATHTSTHTWDSDCFSSRAPSPPSSWGSTWPLVEELPDSTSRRRPLSANVFALLHHASRI